MAAFFFSGSLSCVSCLISFFILNSLRLFDGRTRNLDCVRDAEILEFVARTSFNRFRNAGHDSSKHSRRFPGLLRWTKPTALDLDKSWSSTGMGLGDSKHRILQPPVHLSRFQAEFRRKVSNKGRPVQESARCLSGRRTSWVIYDYFTISDTDGAVLDIDNLLLAKLKNDNVRVKSVSSCKLLLTPCVRDTVRKTEHRTYS